MPSTASRRRAPQRACLLGLLLSLTTSVLAWGQLRTGLPAPLVVDSLRKEAQAARARADRAAEVSALLALNDQIRGRPMEAAVLLRQMERKFGPPGEAVRQRIAQADAETLLRWSERILTADSPEAVLH